MGAAVTALAGASDWINLPAAASGGAMSDFGAISGVAGVAVGAPEAPDPADGTVAGPGSGGPESILGFSAVFAAVVVTEDTAGAGAGVCDAVDGSAIAGGACGEAAVCRAIAPVTESKPCSSTVIREYSRSRSPLSVSMAEASRRVSLWLSLAADWICCACRARSAAATCSRRKPIDDWVASMATITAPTEAAPHDPSRHSARRSN